MRILLAKNGEYKIEYKPILPSTTTKIKISEKIIDSKNRYLQHKTTFRPWYSDSLHKILSGEIFDEIFFNEKGELTEGSRSNIVLDLEFELFTPPLSSGLLNGIERRKMLNDGRCKEKVLYLNDLLSAKNIYCINSVRGINKVELV